MNPIHRSALALMAVGAGLSVSACGSSSETSSSTGAASSTATKAAFVAQAEKICDRVSTEQAPLKARQETGNALSAKASEQAFVTVAQQLVKISRKAEQQLQKLPRPTQDATTIANLLTVYSDEITDVSDIANAVANQQGTGAEAASSALKRAIAAGQTDAKSLGIERCIGAS